MISFQRMSSLAIAAACAFASTSARAQSEADRVAAETLFVDAKRLMELGRFDEACPKLVDSQRLDPAAGTLLNLGRCYKENGRLASAWAAYRDAAAAARRAGQAERESLAREEAARIESQLTRITIEVPAASRVAGLTILRDGAALPEGLWNVAAPVDAGAHVIVAQAPERAARRFEVHTGAPGSTVRVKIPALALDPASRTLGSAKVNGAAQLDSAPRSGPPTAAYVSGGIGIAAMVAGVVFGVLAKNRHDEATELCPASPCASRKGVSANDDAETLAWLANVGFGVGVAGVGVGTYLWLSASPAPDQPASSASASSVSASGTQVLLRGRW